MTGYRSIFLAPDWQHVRFLGWKDAWPHPDFRVMTQPLAPLKRVLVVNAIEDEAAFREQWTAVVRTLAPTSELCLHDLTGSEAVRRIVEAAGLAWLGNSARLLNIATFVIDVSPDQDTLFNRLSSDTRRKVRKAERSAMLFDAEAHRDPAQVDAFLHAFATMADERHLHSINGDVVRAMIDAGFARLFAVGDAPGAKDSGKAYLLSYETAGTGFFLYGASSREKQNDGSGALLHWEVIKAFKAAGLSHYDMGGLPSLDSENGIYRFKKAFGGELVDLGAEYGKTGALFGLARSASGMIGRLRRKAA